MTPYLPGEPFATARAQIAAQHQALLAHLVALLAGRSLVQFADVAYCGQPATSLMTFRQFSASYKSVTEDLPSIGEICQLAWTEGQLINLTCPELPAEEVLASVTISARLYVPGGLIYTDCLTDAQSGLSLRAIADWVIEDDTLIVRFDIMVA